MQVKKQSNRRKVTFQPFAAEDIKNLPEPLRTQAECLYSLSREDISRIPLITSTREYREYMEKNRTMNSTSQSNRGTQRPFSGK